jgi:uncharacterized membrane protein
MKDTSLNRYMTLTIGVILCSLVVARYVSLSSNVADLGFFLNNFFMVDTEWQRAFYGHVQPLMPSWGAAYRALPTSVAPIVLVLSQAFVLIGSVLAIWRVFGPWPGMAMLLYYPLWANALFDFHFDHLTIPILTAFFIACEWRRFGWATLFAASLVLVKEPFALQTVACGLYFIWLAFHHRGLGVSLRLVGLGALLSLFGAGWFYGATHWLLPYFGDGSRGALQSEAFSWLGSSLSDMIWTLISRPGEIFAEIFHTTGKLLYLAVIFGSLAFIPLLRPAALIVALPVIMIAMLSRLENYYGYANHYTAGVIVPAIIAFRNGLQVAGNYFTSVVEWSMEKCKSKSQHLTEISTFTKIYTVSDRNPQQIFSFVLCVWLLVAHWALASSPISRLFWSDKVWSYSSHAYTPTEREIWMKNAILEHIPKDRDVSVTTQNTVNWYHLANRRIYLPFPLAVYKPHKVIDWSNRDLSGFLRYVREGVLPITITHAIVSDYVVLDLKRPWFVIDKGCDWLYDLCRNDDVAAEFLELVRRAQQSYRTVYLRDEFMILKRK